MLTVKCAQSIAGYCKFASAESQHLTFVHLPIARTVVSKLQQAVLGIVTLTTLGAFQVAAPACTLPVIVFRDNKGSTATAGHEVHFQDFAFWWDRHKRSIQLSRAAKF
ncbi:MAG: hypothetical protein DMG89_09675 [Acidobacteria bacterium]|nr:MAG: hypothetical protein DMG89_09675 [Acidobacteriota bacterium]